MREYEDLDDFPGEFRRLYSLPEYDIAFDVYPCLIKMTIRLFDSDEPEETFAFRTNDIETYRDENGNPVDWEIQVPAEYTYSSFLRELMRVGEHIEEDGWTITSVMKNVKIMEYYEHGAVEDERLLQFVVIKNDVEGIYREYDFSMFDLITRLDETVAFHKNNKMFLLFERF